MKHFFLALHEVHGLQKSVTLYYPAFAPDYIYNSI